MEGRGWYEQWSCYPEGPGQAEEIVWQDYEVQLGKV